MTRRASSVEDGRLANGRTARQSGISMFSRNPAFSVMRNLVGITAMQQKVAQGMITKVGAGNSIFSGGRCIWSVVRNPIIDA